LHGDEVDDGVDFLCVFGFLGFPYQLLQLESPHFALFIELVTQVANDLSAQWRSFDNGPFRDPSDVLLTHDPQ